MNEEDPWSNVDDAFLSKPAAPQKPESEAEPVAKPTKQKKQNKKPKGKKKEARPSSPPDAAMEDVSSEPVPEVQETKVEKPTAAPVNKPEESKPKSKPLYKRSQEEGFVGPPEKWFDDDSFKKSVIKDLEYNEKLDYYFDSYSHFNIHEEMIKDRVRTESYQAAIESNPGIFQGKVVLDIGCGTGILSMFAARAGAKMVIGVDNADIVHYAREIVKKNGFGDRIVILKGKMEEVELPVEKVDIIVSEWMGYFLLYEAMLDTVLWARDKYLVPGGVILPDKCTMHVAAIEDASYKKEKMTFWDDVYGFDMSCMTPATMVEPLVDTINPKVIVSNACKFFEFDINTVTKEELDFSATYSLTMHRHDKIHGIVTWFDIEFGHLDNVVRFSTGP